MSSCVNSNKQNKIKSIVVEKSGIEKIYKKIQKKFKLKNQRAKKIYGRDYLKIGFIKLSRLGFMLMLLSHVENVT